jgi:hypothetical protein
MATLPAIASIPQWRKNRKLLRGYELAEITRDPVQAALVLADISRGMVVVTECTPEQFSYLEAVSTADRLRARYLRAAERAAIEAGAAKLSDFPPSSKRVA